MRFMNNNNLQFNGPKNQRILYLICAATIIVILLNNTLNVDSRFIAILLTVAGLALNIFWIFLMSKTSKYWKTIYGRLTLLLIAVTIVGLLFKLQHWPSAALLMFIGLAGIMVVYLFRFLAKSSKNLVDILKMLWLQSAGSISLLLLNRMISREYSIISSFLFVILICVFTLRYHETIQVKNK